MELVAITGIGALFFDGTLRVWPLGALFFDGALRVWPLGLSRHTDALGPRLRGPV